MLERLAASEHRPALVVTRPDAPRGRGRRLQPPPVAETARALGLELIQPERLHDEDVLERIAAAEPEALAVCAYGALIREPLLSAYEILNVHPSLLPRWRGAAPIERAIMAGDEVTGVSIIRLVEALDAGPVCLQGEEPIRPDDDYGTLSARLERLSGELLVRALVRAAAVRRAGRGRRHLRAQDRGARPGPGLHAAARGGRAPGARAAPAHRRAAAAARRRVHGRARGAASTATRSRPAGGRVRVEDGRLLLDCNGGALELTRIRPPGGKEMDAARVAARAPRRRPHRLLPGPVAARPLVRRAARAGPRGVDLRRRVGAVSVGARLPRRRGGALPRARHGRATTTRASAGSPRSCSASSARPCGRSRPSPRRRWRRWPRASRIRACWRRSRTASAISASRTGSTRWSRSPATPTRACARRRRSRSPAARRPAPWTR